MFVCLLLPPAVKYAGTSLKSSYHTIDSTHIFCLHLIVSRKDMKIKCYFGHLGQRVLLISVISQLPGSAPGGPGYMKEVRQRHSKAFQSHGGFRC